MDTLLVLNPQEFWEKHTELTRQIIKEEIKNALPNLNSEEILVIDDVCLLVKRKDKTIYNWMKSNIIKHHYVGGSLYFLRSEIIDLIKQG